MNHSHDQSVDKSVTHSNKFKITTKKRESYKFRYVGDNSNALKLMPMEVRSTKSRGRKPPTG